MDKRRTVYTFGAFHYDVAYRNTFEGYLEMSFDAIRAGLRLLAKYPDYTFVIEQVILVRELLARHPEAREPMRQFAQAGRLSFAPGMFTMPDVNLTNGESFIHNAMIGRDWLMENMGVAPKICWMADIFGHHSQLPQLAKLCGFIGYMFERGKTNGDDATFWWEGIDGSRILTQWEIDTYFGLSISLTPYRVGRGQEWVADYAEKMLLDPLDSQCAASRGLLTAMGGDFRKPDDKDIAFVQAYNRLGRKYRIVFGSPDDYFAGVAGDDANSLPVVMGDFNPLMQGVYSSRIRIKQANRRLENLVSALELLEAGLALNKRPIQDSSSSLWEKLAWNAFHDIIAGTLEDNALRETLRDYQGAERQGRQALEAAMRQCVGGRLRTSTVTPNRVVTLFNSLPYERDEDAAIPLDMYGDNVKAVRVFDPAGKPVETQFMMKREAGATRVLDLLGKDEPAVTDAARVPEAAFSGEALLLARVTLPPCSVRSFGIVMLTPKEARSSAGGLAVHENRIENRYLRAVVGKNGTIISLFDKENRREFADPDRSPVAQRGMNNIALQPDRGDLWNLYQGPVNGSLLYTAPLRDPVANTGIELQRKGAVGCNSADADTVWWPSISAVEAGPLRTTLEISYPGHNVTTRVSLGRDEKMLRFETRFTPKGKHYRLRVAFPTAIRSGRIRTSIPCGFVVREEGEYAAQNWMEYADAEGGLCLLNRGLPGNNVTDGVMILSLFRGVAMEDAESSPWYEEGVEQVFEYALRPFGKNDRDYNPARLGALFNRPLYPMVTNAVPSGPRMDSVLVLDSHVAEVMAFRRLGKDFEVRLYDSQGKGGAVGLIFRKRVVACRRTDCTGKPIRGKPVRVKGKRIDLDLKPFEIVTFRLSLM